MRVPKTARGRLLAVVVVLVVVFAAATARLFVWPPIDSPTRVDAVVALGGDPGQHRAKEAIKLVESGFAPVAVVSLGGNPPVSCPRHPVQVRVLCFRGAPLPSHPRSQPAP